MSTKIVTRNGSAIMIIKDRDFKNTDELWKGLREAFNRDELTILRKVKREGEVIEFNQLTGILEKFNSTWFGYLDDLRHILDLHDDKLKGK